MKAKTIITEVDKTFESRGADWTLILDENCKSLKSPLADLGFTVRSVESGMKDFAIHQWIKKTKNSASTFFITQNGKDFVHFLDELLVNYSILWIDQKLMADPKRTAKAIEGAVLYDSRLKVGGIIRRITGQYITDLPKKRKEYMISLKKKK